MSMVEWAENEIKLACDKEELNQDWGQYDIACYRSALKAFKTLTKDNHSGMSIKLTQSILNRLIDGKPLTPIEDIPENWDEAFKCKNEVHKQCNRMSSLFKRIKEDGTVTYSDSDRVICYDVEKDATYGFGFVTSIIDEMFPITFPYAADVKYTVYCEDDEKDTNKFKILYAKDSNGKVTQINKTFVEIDGKMKEVTE